MDRDCCLLVVFGTRTVQVKADKCVCGVCFWLDDVMSTNVKLCAIMLEVEAVMFFKLVSNRFGKKDILD